jgi:hypothetical protein
MATREAGMMASGSRFAPGHAERPARGLGWVPAGAWLAPGYAEWAPPAALRGVVACLWASVVPDGADRGARPYRA